MARLRNAHGPAGAGRDAPADATWPTALTRIVPNTILVRGYSVDELMGRLSFGEAIYLLLIGELPSPTVGRLVEALLISSVDHGVTPPSTLAARHVATTGAPLRASVAAGVLAFGQYHGGDVSSCLRFLEGGVARVRRGESLERAANAMLEPWRARGEAPPGFGHRFHSRDPRTDRLFQMAMELELEGTYVQMIRTLERLLQARTDSQLPVLPVNVDGAIASVCGDLGLDPEIGDALFIISRVPGLIAHAREERVRHGPMRQIDPGRHIYDGPSERRLPETRRVR